MAEKIRERSEIPVEDTWAIEDLYPSDEAWEQELATLETDKADCAAFAGRLGESAQTLYDYFARVEQVSVKVSRLANYASRRADVDTRNATYQAMVGKFYSKAVALNAARAFETPEIMAITDEQLDTSAGSAATQRRCPYERAKERDNLSHPRAWIL